VSGFGFFFVFFFEELRFFLPSSPIILSMPETWTSVLVQLMRTELFLITQYCSSH